MKMKKLKLLMNERLKAPRYFFNYSIIENNHEIATSMSDAYENNSDSAFLIENILEKQEKHN